MENNAELLRLEGFVDKLLAKYNQLKADFHTLEETLQERDAECADLKEVIRELKSERTEVGSRVSNLLDRIEQWENEHTAGAESVGSQAGGVQGSLFSGETENR